MSRRLLEKNFCVIPWTGFELEPNGNIKNCIISKSAIGNIHKQHISDIVRNNPTRKLMLEGQYPTSCEGCYLQEKHRANNFESISSRLYYAKELANKIPKDLLDKDNFSLKHVDLRWSNKCNQACTYCGPEYSSKWATERGIKISNDKERIERLKEYVYSNIQNLENVYLAGGEPLLMKQNKDFLDRLHVANPNCTIGVSGQHSEEAEALAHDVVEPVGTMPTQPRHEVPSVLQLLQANRRAAGTLKVIEAASAAP